MRFITLGLRWMRLPNDEVPHYLMTYHLCSCVLLGWPCGATCEDLASTIEAAFSNGCNLKGKCTYDWVKISADVCKNL